MRIRITKSCFQPNGSKVPNILKMGTEHTLEDKEAQILIDKGYASKVEPKKAESDDKPEKVSKKKAEKTEDTPQA